MSERISISALPGRVEALLRERERVVLALDGPCAGGKTTLALRLAAEQGWGVVHMDDFFLRPAQRTPERYATPGGNVDYERFLAEVLEPLERGRPAEFRPLDCATLTFADPVRLEPGRVLLVEGGYACHPALWDHYDLRLFLPVEPQVQLERLRRRCPERLGAFEEKWIPLERAYFAAYRLPERCDLILT